MKPFNLRAVLSRVIALFLLALVVFPSNAGAATQLFNPEQLTAGVVPAERNILETDEITGAFNYSYPIVVPPGRNGLQPDLKLTYNNQQRDNYPNIMGYGWATNIPYIDRVNRSGTNKLYTDNYFYSSLSGELVLVSGSTYGPKVENGSFLTYTYDGTYWTVKDKKGTVYKFGTNAAERQDNPSDSTKVFKWMLQDVRDTNNNYIKYEYYKDGGQIYPYKIKYTGNNVTDGIFEVEFLRQTRSDVAKSYATAFLVTTSYRINEVQVKVSGTWTRKYALSYTTGDNGLRSLLSSITESGQDESSNVTTLPATSFTYYTSTTGWESDTTTWTAPQSVGGALQSFLDVNGDALPDIIESYTASPSDLKKVFLNNGDGTWTNNTGLQPPILFRKNEIRGGSHDDTWDQGVRVVDVNGDLLPDIIKAEDNGNGNGGFDAYINTGSGWTQNSTWHPTVTFNGDNNIDSWGSHAIDLNSDGLTDIIRKKNSFFGSQINSGTAFGTESSTAWDPGASEIVGPKAQFVDVNNDGLPDIVYMVWNVGTGATDKTTYINKGDGNWTTDSAYNPPVDTVTPSDADAGVRFFDVNGDGLVDLVPDYSYMTAGRNTHLNTGSGWTSASAWNVPSDVNVEFDTGPVNIVDVNTDGTLDFFYTSGSNPMTTKVWKNKTTTPTDTLKKITFPQGGETTITYKRTPNYKSGSTVLNPSFPIPLDTVYQTSTVDGNGVTSTETFTYEGGLYNFTAWNNRRPAGFSKVTKVDTAGNKTINYYHQGNTTNSSQGEYDDHVSKIGKIYRTETTDSSGNIYEKTVHKWDKYNLGTGRDFVKLVRTTTLTYDGDSDHKDKTEEYTYDNTYGNLTQKVMWGEVTGSDDGSYTDTGTDKFTEDISYVANTSNYVVGLPYQDTVADQSSNKVRESKIYYDTLSLGSVGAGNETKVERWKTGTTYVNTQKAYNTTYGVVTSSTDERGKTTTYTLDTHYLYPATVTNALSQATSYTYDYSAGKAKQVTDPNSFVYQTIFDGLDRVTAEKVPDLSSPYDPVTKTAYTYTDTSGSVSILKTENLDGSTSALTYQYFDGLNRLIQERVEAEETGYYNARDIVYNTIGLVDKESLPYTSSGSSKTTATTTTALLTTYSYDPMKRITSVVNAVGTTSNAYDDWKTTITDPRSKTKHLYNDAYGNLTRVDEVSGGNTYSTYYEWNGNKLLTKITDASSNVRNFVYNGLGKRTSAEDLHATSDASFGTWTYTYDDAGNLTQTVDPKSQTIDYTYNDINQVLTENYTGGTGTEVTYTYGGCTNGTGKLCNIDTVQAVDTDYTYNSNSGVASEVKTISSTGYTTSYTYDRQGNVLEITNPDSSKVKYIYNTAGLLEKIQRKESTDGSYIDVVTNFTYGPHRKVTKQENLNETATEYTYDSAKLYRLTRILSNWLGGIGGPEDLGELDPEILEALGLPVEEVAQTPAPEVVTPEVPEEPAQKTTQNVEAQPQTPEEKVLKVIEDGNKKEFLTANGIYKRIGKDDKGQDVITAQIYNGPVNFFDSKVGKWKKIDTKPVDKGEEFTVTEAPYEAKVKKSLESGKSFLSFKNETNTINFSLIETSNFEGQANPDEFKVTYPNALGNSIDLEITTLPTSVRKEAVIKSKEALGSLSGKEFYEIPFKVTLDSDLTITDENGTTLTENEPLTTNGQVTLTNKKGVKTYFWAPMAVDNNGRPVSIDIRYELKNDGIYLTKLLPVEWLEKASYPVTTDTVTSYYAGSGDGYLWYTANPWDTAHDATSGNSNTTWTTAFVQSDKHYAWSNESEISRAALPIDTSELPDDAEISSAKLKINIHSRNDNDDDGNDFIRVVQTTTASSTSLTGEDFDQIGAVDNPTAGATDKDITGISSSGGWEEFTLNSTGLGWINKTGYTKLGLREGHDVVDEMPNLYADGIRFYTANGSYPPYLEVTYTIPNQAPSAPTNLEVEGLTTPTAVQDTTPDFTAVYNDPNPGDLAASYQIQVSTSTDFTTPLWNSTKTTLGSQITAGNESAELAYGGTALALDGATYYWRIKFWDDDDAEGSWSSTASFTMYDSAIDVLQDLNFTYDNNGNITQIIDASETSTSKTVAYVYDDLNRLTSATATSVASGQSTYTHTFTYDAIGNFTNKSDVGNYSYAGTNNANPHAATSINSVTHSYDNNGNLTGDGTWTYTWDHKNRLATAGNGSTTTYTYDQNGSRAKVVGTSTTVIPTQYYSKEGSTDVKYIYAGNQLVATVRGTGASAAVYYMHTDHLGGSGAITATNGALKELTDYFPYGEQRVHETNGLDDRKGYIGKDFDSTTGLSYMNARYYEGAVGRFISQDATHLWLGEENKIRQLAKQSLQGYLSDPQQLNSYSYARGNPINRSDPTGNNSYLTVGSAAFVTSLAWSAGSDIYQNIQDYRSGNLPWYRIGQARGENPAGRYIKNAVATIAVAESAVAAEAAALARGATKIVSQIIGATTAGTANVGAGIITGSSMDPTTNGVNLTAVGTDFVTGFTGTVIGQQIPNPVGRPPTTVGTSVAGLRAITEQFRSQIGQVVQGAGAYLTSFTKQQKPQ